ncbi:MAG: HAMP domain-containing histidine kinase [Paenibacillus lautus]|jgi:signal transduction histidine kinase|uniref:sensor histidine kinase n=1 Tax=Paenibacillus lautus TaxID=1401 RepID=UPI0026F13597|nr:HAMP domain-containing sensor histidine kinase [Paenibacillus lautus]MCI1778197.1 HAMP domain-containing histidine kinase [Paenibacillus lautus]
MRWKLTGRYLVSVVVIVVIVIIMNIIVVIGLFVVQSLNEDFLTNGRQTSAETISRSFEKFIVISESGVSVSEKGKDILKKNEAWLQILDEDGSEVYRYRAPEGAKTKYTPIDMVQIYKYFEKDVLSTVFIGEKTYSDHRFSYLVGFTSPYLERQVLTIDTRNFVQTFKIFSLTLIIVDGFIALCIAYIFSKRLTKPMFMLIDSIKRLANRNYHVFHQPKGVYKDVFANINLLSQELQASEKERKKLDAMREEWIGNISHDIKTPLASIQGYAEMMKDPEYQFSQDEIRDYAGIIERKSIYLRDMIEDLNLSTRLRNKELILNKKHINIVSLVRNAVIDTLNNPSYSDRDIDFGSSHEVIQVEVDDILIRRAISNLIYNAIVHNREDVAIKVQVEKNEGHILIRVEDNGKGIKEEELGRIFDRYFRGTNTGELHKGSGLGMAITHDIVIAHGGEIEVRSEFGQGTIAEIKLRHD